MFITSDEGDPTWELPESSYFKIKCDGSWFSTSKGTGYRCIVRDITDCVISVKADFFENGSSSMEAEDISIFQVMCYAGEAKWRKCIFETNCCEVYKALYAGSGNLEQEKEWIRRCKWYLVENMHCRLSLVRREGNALLMF